MTLPWLVEAEFLEVSEVVGGEEVTVMLSKISSSGNISFSYPSWRSVIEDEFGVEVWKIGASGLIRDGMPAVAWVEKRNNAWRFRVTMLNLKSLETYRVVVRGEATGKLAAPLHITRTHAPVAHFNPER